MRVKAIRCRKCGDTIFSRCRHDFRRCSCKAVAIDGGFDYTQITGDKYKEVTVSIPQTVEQLHNDWNRWEDSFGLIRGKKA